VLAFNQTDTVVQGTDFGPVISGSGSVFQLGSGTLMLLGTNTYTGPTVVSAGTLQLGAGGTGGGLNAAGAAAIVVKRKRDRQGPERAGGGGGGGGGIRDMESARKQETWKDEVKGGGRGRRDEEVEPRRKRPGEDEAGLGDQRKGGQTLRTFDDLRYPIPCR
jgi:autotransporter-associated beta strand protein